jgi:hypothetical protein
MLVGAIVDANAAIASLTVGDAVVEYSTHLASDPGYVPSLGEPVEVSGVQPALGGKIVAGLHDGALVTLTSLSN